MKSLLDTTGMTIITAENYFFDETTAGTFGYNLKMVMGDIYDFFKCQNIIGTEGKNCTAEELALKQWGDSQVTKTLSQDYQGNDTIFKQSDSILSTFKNSFAF
jgi:hypothetical protein